MIGRKLTTETVIRPRGAAPAIDYHHCRYDDSRLLFRGPRRGLDGRHVVAVGSTATYGRFVPEPWPVLLEAALGRPVANLGYPNAGIDLVSRSRSLQGACASAAACVVEVMGVGNMSNRFYSVHPRHNDRFLMPSHELGRLYPEVDFTEFAFVRHMLGALEALAPDRFRLVLAEMRDAWAARMRVFLMGIEGPAILLRIAGGVEGRPATGGPSELPPAMVAALAEDTGAVAVSVEEAPGMSRAGIAYAPAEAAAADTQPAPAVHAAAARAIMQHLPDLLLRPRRSLQPTTEARRTHAPRRVTTQTFPVISGTASNRSATSP